MSPVRAALALAVLSAACTERTPPPARPGPGFQRAGSAFESDSLRVEDGQVSWKGTGVSLDSLAAGPATTRLEADGRLSVERGEAVEHLELVEGGLHQTFHFTEAPGGTGDLTVRVRFAGARPTGQTVTGHHFRADLGGTELTYGPATWVDADGRRTPLETRLDPDGALALIVPAATLASTAWPADLDPIITARSNLNQPVSGFANMAQQTADVAFDGTNYLVVWYDTRDISGYLAGVHGARVSAQGTVLDPSGFIIFTSLAHTTMPAVAFDGTNYLVVGMDSSGAIRLNRVTPQGAVLDGPNGRQVDSTSAYVEELDIAAGPTTALIAFCDHIPGSGHIRARLMTTAGTPLGPQRVITAFPSGDQVPATAFNGTDFLVTWRREQRFSNAPVMGVRVAIDGGILDPTPITFGIAAADRLSVATAAVGDTWLVTWQGTNGVLAARMAADGGLLDNPPLVVWPSTSYTEPTVASDGTRFNVSWLRYDTVSYDYDLVVNRVSATGALLDGTGVPVALDLRAEEPSGACSGSQCLWAWTNTQGLDIFAARAQGVTPQGAPIHVSASASQQDWPAIARSATQYFVVWDDLRGGTDRQIWGARVSLTGQVLDPAGIPICTAPADQTMPRVAATAAGDFFVVWADRRAQVTTYVSLYGTRVLADGTVVTPNGARLTTEDDAQEPSIASDGTNYLLTWYESSAPFYNDIIYASRLSAAGAMLDNPPLMLTPTGGGSSPTVAWGAGVYLVAFEGPGGMRAVRIPPSGAPLDAYPGAPIGYGELPSATFDGRQFVVGHRRYDTGSRYHMWATRVLPDGGVAGDGGTRLSTTSVYGYSSAYYRMAPEASFDGVDSVFTWASNFEGGEVFAAYLHPDGGAFGTSTLVSVPQSIPLSPTIAGRGDGDHALLVYVYGDTTPGIRNFRVGSQELTFRVDGHACSTSAECKSGSCVDGVCCNTACGGGAANDCQVCSAALGATADGVCTPLPSGRACGAATGGACDLPDTCDGVSGLCANRVAPATTVCRASAGACDREERCDGLTPACPADALEPTTTTCRAAAGGCDVAERCTGTSAACPADVLVSSGTSCRASAGACDVAETCSGTSAQCPADVLSGAGTLCRASAGACDVAEACSGTSAQCPSDAFQPASVTCRAAAGICDVEESCSGFSAACPADQLRPAGLMCRAPAGACDVAESCTGSSAACPADLLRPSGTTCRAAAGVCDVAETCSGTSAACAPDALRPSGVTCRAAAGPCDVAESCSGSAPGCPADAFQPSTVTCRASAGPCDVAESCSGGSASCPANAFAPATTVCRPASGACDAAERCSGAAGTCPVDALAPDGTTCGATTTCSSSRVCRAGACVDGAARNCDDGDACTADACAEGTGCTHAPIAGCCSSAAQCDDGDACTADACGAGNACSHEAIAGCCRAAADCDDQDPCTDDSCGGGACQHAPAAQCQMPATPGGCGCGTGGGLGFALAALGLLRGRRPASRRSGR